VSAELVSARAELERLRAATGWIVARDGGRDCLRCDDYIGNWVTGFGYINVRFPRATTRDLTPAERARYDGAELELSGRPYGSIQLDPEPDGTDG